MTFQELNLDEALLKAITDLGYEQPTEIQEKAIPLLVKGHQDFVGQAQTGTGKTAAFVLPLLSRLNPKARGAQALILAPTRELAKQIDEEIYKLSKYMNVKTACIYGGASYDRQITQIRKNRPQIIVGTPGRVIDLMKRGELNFSDSEFLILDEADEMLKMGFYDDVQMVLDSFNLNRMMWMFSATMPREIKQLIERECDHPEMVTVKKKSISNDDIEQIYYPVTKKQFAEAIYRLVISEKDAYGMVFCKTRGEAKDLTSNLIDRDLKVECLNGDMAQQLREKAMDRFKARKVQLLVCTDVAARGIDVNDMTHVFNYGLPQDIESYVHRIGRTGRAGKKGIAATIIDPRDLGGLRRIEKTINCTIKKADLPTQESLKTVIIAKDLEKMDSIKEAVIEKKEEFKIDPAYEAFEKFFEGANKEELGKILFTYMYNRELRRLDDIGVIPEGKSGSRDYKRVRGGRGYRGGSRTGGPGGQRREGGRSGGPRSQGGYRGQSRRSEGVQGSGSGQRAERRGQGSERRSQGRTYNRDSDGNTTARQRPERKSYSRSSERSYN